MKNNPPFDPSEHVICEKRRHWIYLVSKLLVVVLLAILPLIAVAVLMSSAQIETTDYMLTAFLGFYSIWLLLLWISVFYIWTVFILDIWVVTDKQFIDIEQIGLFHREISTLSLDKVQDITVEVSGLLATWLDFGKVIVQTAGQEREFIIPGIRNPYDFKKQIECACEDHKKRTQHISTGI